MSAAFFGVELSSDTTQYAELQYNSLTIGNAGSNTQITPAGVTFPDSTVQTTASTSFNGGTIGNQIVITDVSGSSNYASTYWQNNDTAGNYNYSAAGETIACYYADGSGTRLDGPNVSIFTSGQALQFVINPSTGITFPDDSVQSSAAFVPGSGNLDMAGYDITNANFNSSAGQVSAQNVTLSSGGSITFPDSTVQTTASTVGEAPQDNVVYGRVDGVWVPIPGAPTYTLIATGYTSIAGWLFSGTNIYLGSNGHVITDTPGYANGNGSNFTINGSDTAGATLDLSSFTGITNPIQLLSISSSNAPILPSSLATSGVEINGYAPANLPSAIFGYSSISNLNISNANNITSIPSLSGLSSLQSFYIDNCASITSLPNFNSSVNGLISFTASNNASLTSTPELTSMSSLNYISISGNPALTTIPQFSNLPAATQLNITNNTGLVSPPTFGTSTSFNSELALVIAGNASMIGAPTLEYGKYVTIENNTSMTGTPLFYNGSIMNTLHLNNNTSMTLAPSFNGFTSLYNATLYGNASMTSAPDFSGCTSLIYANTSGCAITNCTDILDQLDANGVSGGYCDISGGTNQSIDPTYVSLLSLQSKGWTVVFNSL
jgi:hypothetical protein